MIGIGLGLGGGRRPRNLLSLRPSGIWTFGNDGGLNSGSWWEPDGNLLAWSEDFGNAVWAKTGVAVVANQAADPNGDATADRLSFEALNSNVVQQDVAVSQVLNQAFVFAVWLKADAPTTVRLGITQPTVADFTSGDLGVTAEWQRVSFTATPTAESPTTVRVRVINNPSGTTGVIYAYGAQLNPGTTPATYAKTEAKQRAWDWSTSAAHLVRGSASANTTNDYGFSVAGSVVGALFDGVDDQVSSLPALAADYTVVNVNATQVHIVDSAGGQYINDAVDAGATNFNIGVAGGYSGVLALRAHFDRVLNASQRGIAYRDIKAKLNANRGMGIL